MKRICGNCQLAIKRKDAKLICGPMDKGVFTKEGHRGWFAQIVDADEKACLSRFVASQEVLHA